MQGLLFLLVVAGALVACGANSRSADSPDTTRPLGEGQQSSAGRTPSNAHPAVATVAGDADADRVLDRARAALVERWGEWCWRQAWPAIDNMMTGYLPTALDVLERDLLASSNKLDELGCERTEAMAHTWMYVGLVRAGENRDRQGAEQAFREALRIDPAAQLDEVLADEQTRSTWSRLQKELGSRKRRRVHVPDNEHAGLLLDLRKAGLCSSCSVARRARAWILLGTWQALRGETGAVDSFREALSLDPAAELDDRVRPAVAREAMQMARTPSSSK